MRRERLNWFDWTELTGVNGQPPRTATQHLRDDPTHSAHGLSDYVPYEPPHLRSGHPTETNYVERARNTCQQTVYQPLWENKDGRTWQLNPPSSPVTLKRKLESESSTDRVSPPSKREASLETPTEPEKRTAREKSRYLSDILGCARRTNGFEAQTKLDRHVDETH